MKRGLTILVVCCLLLMAGTSSVAEMKRGSSGDEVVQLQQQMIDIGALNDAADGKFGRKTEQAVKDLQAYWGQKRTGIADQEFLDELSILWYTLNEEEIGSEQFSEEELEELGLFCCPTEAEIEYCPRHEFLAYLKGLLKKDGREAPAGVQSKIYQRIVLLGYPEILTMCDVWEDRMDDAGKYIVQERREAFITGFEDVFGNIHNYEHSRPWLVSLDTWEGMRAWIMQTVVNNCFDLYGYGME